MYLPCILGMFWFAFTFDKTFASKSVAMEGIKKSASVKFLLKQLSHDYTKTMRQMQ